MTTKHTPGPWAVHPLDRRAVCGPDDDIAIASVHTWRDTSDATLIAAAPDLLDALEAMVNDVDDNAPGAFSGVQKARTAIAKAKGKS